VMGPFTLKPGAVEKVDVAFVTARGDNGPESSVELMKEYIDQVKQYYYENPDYFGYQWLGVDEKPNIVKNSLMVFPNPATNEIFIDHSSESSHAVYKIFDIFGRQVRQGIMNPDGSSRISLEGLEKGLYVVTVLDGNTLRTAKVMKK